MNYQNYFETLKEQKTIERNYKLSLENYKNEVIYQAYVEVIDFLSYIHQQGYRRADGNPVNVMLDTPENLKSTIFNNIKRNGGEILILDNDIHVFVILYKDDGILIECSNTIGAKKVFTSVENFIRKISQVVLDTFVLITPESLEMTETSNWNQLQF